MTSIDIVENKISSIRRYLSMLKAYKKFSLKQIEQDPTLRGAIERYLYLATQATIDLAEAVIAFKDFRKPATYREAFDILGEEKFLSQKMLEKLIDMAKFRNVIAHDYEKLDYSVIYDVLQNRLTDIEAFVRQVNKKLGL